MYRKYLLISFLKKKLKNLTVESKHYAAKRWIRISNHRQYFCLVLQIYLLSEVVAAGEGSNLLLLVCSLGHDRRLLGHPHRPLRDDVEGVAVRRLSDNIVALERQGFQFFQTYFES